MGSLIAAGMILVGIEVFAEMNLPLPLRRLWFVEPLFLLVGIAAQIAIPILGLVSFFLVLGMLSHARKAFRKAADDARSNWIGPIGQP